MNEQQIGQRMEEINDESLEIVDRAQAMGRDLTEDECATLNSLDNMYKTLKRQLDMSAFSQGQGTGRITDPDRSTMGSALEVPNGSKISYAGPGRNSGGFRSFGEFASAVYQSGVQGYGGVDPRLLKNAPTTVSTEGVGADGGYAVPPDYRDAIMQEVLGEDSLLSRCNRIETPSNEIHLPASEEVPWQTSGGLLSYWTGENTQLTQSKVSLKDKLVRLNKLTALIPVTSELLEDSPSIDAYLRRMVPTTFNSKINLSILQGTGAGEPLGILNCGSKIEVTKESGQSADSVVWENIVNMFSRMYGPWRRNAVWLINQDIEPQLFSMSWEGTSSSVPAYLPAGQALVNAPAPTLLGRPVIPVQACETLGDAGDIIFADFSQYVMGIKSSFRTDVSIHLWFDYDTIAYRFVMRVGGQCLWSAAIDPRDGSNTMSAFVTLQART